MPTNKTPFTPDGPIPGENYTSDTRNYPWHRPPQFADLDTALDACLKRLTSKESAYGLLTMLQSGVTVVQATDIFLTGGIGEGKFTLDTALLLAGPVAHIIKILAEDADIKYKMGTEDGNFATIAFVKAKAIDESVAVKAADAVMDQSEEIKEQAGEQTPPQPGMVEEGQGQPTPPTDGGGFMGMPAPKQEGMM